MDMDLAQARWLLRGDGAARLRGQKPSLDWAGLAARLAAAQALRRHLESANEPVTGRSGSFDEGSAALVTGFAIAQDRAVTEVDDPISSRAVNPVDSGAPKGPAGIEDGTPGRDRLGDRGWK